MGWLTALAILIGADIAAGVLACLIFLPLIFAD
jgi:hypothetical protein